MRQAMRSKPGLINLGLLALLLVFGGAGALALFQRGGKFKFETPIVKGEVEVPEPLSAGRQPVSGHESAKAEMSASQRGTCGDGDPSEQLANGPANLPPPVPPVPPSPSGDSPLTAKEFRDSLKGLESRLEEKIDKKIEPLKQRLDKLEDEQGKQQADKAKKQTAADEAERERNEARKRQDMEHAAKLDALREQHAREAAEHQRRAAELQQHIDDHRAEIAKLRDERQQAEKVREAARKAAEERALKDAEDAKEKEQKKKEQEARRPPQPPAGWNTRVAVGTAPCNLRFEGPLPSSGAEARFCCPKCQGDFFARLVPAPGGWGVITRAAPPRQPGELPPPYATKK